MRIQTPLFRDHPVAALAVICLSVFVISVDATIVNVGLPTLSRELAAIALGAAVVVVFMLPARARQAASVATEPEPAVA